MTPDQSAIVTAILTTAAVGVGGTGAVALLPRSRPVYAAVAAPFVVVASLAAGVGVATGKMLIDDHTAQTLLVVLAACAPIALLVGLLLARRVRAVERRAAAERAEQQRARDVEDSRRETIRWLSHDLRTPLAGIRALAESAESEGCAHLPSAERIVREVDRLDAMVDDIVELSRLHAERTRQVVPTDLDDVVSDAVASVSPLAAAQGVSVIAGALSGDTIPADPREVTRAVTNIVRNAVQHTPAAGTVTVQTKTSASHTTVAVSDGCGGIAAEDLPHLLEPGWRADASRSERGMGLGLAIAAEVARVHGGEVTVTGTAPAPGCTVTLSLARTSPTPAPPKP